MSKGGGASHKRVLGWLGWAGADAVGRLALLTGGTALFSRLLSPRDFGVTALVLTFVAVGAVFVGMPFEEALAQRKRLRRIHLSAALGVSCLVGLAVVAAASLLGLWLARIYGEPQIALMMPVAMLSVFFSGHTAILLALARRLRRFNDAAQASLIGHLVGVALSLLLALAGAGPWALIANRVLIFVAVDIALQWRLGFLVLPRWSPRHVDGFGRFAGISFLDRLADNLTYLLFNNVVEAIYGATTLGYVNMAMRVVEPIRGAVAATGHNLAFSFFAPVGHDSRRLGAMAETVISQSSLVVAPMFSGLAAVTPVLLPLLAGPGWDQAVGVAVCLSVGCALAAPPRLVVTALSAAGRPEFALASTLSSLAATLVALIALAPLGPISVGLARILGDAARLAFAVGLSSRSMTWSRAARMRTLAPAFVFSLAMALVVAKLGAIAPLGRPLAWLVLMVSAGVATYATLLALFARPFFARIVAIAWPVGEGSVNVLVTGAGGFIGRAAVAALRARGFSTRAGLRRAADAPGAVFCDLDAAGRLDAALEGVDLVVHAAYGDVGRMAAQTEALLAAMTRAGARSLVYLSSIAVYGERRGDIAEEAAPQGRLDAYGAAKFACEGAARAWGEAEPARRVVVLRPGIVYGAGSAFWVDKLAERIRAGAWGDFGEAGEGAAALIHVDDLAGMIAELAARLTSAARDAAPPFAALHAVGPETPSWNAYFAAMAAGLRQPSPRLTPGALARRRALRVPAKLWRRLGLPGGRALALAPTGGELALFARRAVYCGEKAKALGLAPRIGLEEGLRRTELRASA